MPEEDKIHTAIESFRPLEDLVGTRSERPVSKPVSSTPVFVGGDTFVTAPPKPTPQSKDPSSGDKV